jgi:hypothetical protein
LGATGSNHSIKIKIKVYIAKKNLILPISRPTTEGFAHKWQVSSGGTVEDCAAGCKHACPGVGCSEYKLAVVEVE